MNSMLLRRILVLLGLLGAAMLGVALFAKTLGLSHGPPGKTRVYLGIAGAVLVLIAIAGKRLPTGYKAAGLMLLNTLVLLGVVEAGALGANRLLGQSFAQAMPRATARHMYLGWVSVDEAEPGVTIDESGHRVTPDGPREESNPIKLFAFGGSTMWGDCVTDEETIPSFLQTELSKQTPVRVTNFGQRGWISTQSLVQLSLELRRGNVPDVVVFYDGYNDVFAGYVNNETGIPENHAGAIRSGAANTISQLVRQSEVARFLARFADPSERPPLRDGLATELTEVYSQVVRQTRALGSEYGFEVHCFVQPQLLTDTRTPTASEQEMLDTHGWLPDPVRTLTFETYDKLKTLAATSDGIVDLTGAFDEVTQQLYFDPCHVNALGNKTVASAMINSGLAETIENLASKRHQTIHD